LFVSDISANQNNFVRNVLIFRENYKLFYDMEVLVMDILGFDEGLFFSLGNIYVSKHREAQKNCN